MELKKKQPIGIELVKRGIVSEVDVQKALEYKKEHPDKRMGEILNIIGAADSKRLLDAIGDILGERTILLTTDNIKINIEDYMSLDVARENKAIPFALEGGKVKVCFAETTDKKSIETIRLLLLNKGLVMDRYITFETNLENVIEAISGRPSGNIKTANNATSLVDSIIKQGIEKRASDIHIEPMDNIVRIRYRIDGELITVANVEKSKQEQLIGRIKSISNMYQEKQESQDGRILMYPNYNIRVSSQKNIYGEKFVLRLLKKNESIKGLFELGFPNDEKLLKRGFNKRNSIVVVAAPTGEGKTTSLYSIIDYLNKPQINITTIEDPVEIRMEGINQIEIDSKISFSGSLRTVLRQDPDIILVGEIRDRETAEIAMESGQTGHYVLSTIHTLDSIEVITRLRKLGVSNYDIASTLATTVSQRLVRKVCPHCAKEREFTEEEKEVIESTAKKYNIEINLEGKKTYETKGCAKCNHTGYLGRIGIFEILIINEELKELIIENASTIKIKQVAIENGFKPLILDGINKVLDGITTLEELDRKIELF